MTTYGSSGMPRSDRNEDFGLRGEPGEKPAECGVDEQGPLASTQARHAELEKILGYTFQDRRFLEESLTHRSLMNEIPEGGRRDNERLEFLGGASSGMSTHNTEGIWPADTGCGTSIPGLYAAGDALGTMYTGALYSMGGTALCGASVTGARAGWSAAEYAVPKRSRTQ